MSKFTVSEYLKRLTSTIWTRRYEVVLMSIRIFLIVTFFAVVIATLAECHPFDHYWQVLPDPGPQCRSGFAQLLVMSSCDIVTDILLVAFPVPIIMRSAMPLRKKITITFLFSLSALLIAITSYRIPTIMSHHGRQQLRTLWASLEILASAAVSNALILGSFVRDRGVKKAKYQGPETGTGRSVSDVNDAQSHLVRTMTRKHWGSDSDEDLFRHCRGRLDSIAEATADIQPAPKAAKPALPSQSSFGQYSPPLPSPATHTRTRKASISTAMSQGIGEIAMSPTLLDVGGILADEPTSSLSQPASSHDGSINPLDPGKERKQPTSLPATSETMTNTKAFDFADIGGLLGDRPKPSQQDKAQARPGAEPLDKRGVKKRAPNLSLGFSSAARRQTPKSTRPLSPRGPDLQDTGGLLGPSTSSSTKRPLASQQMGLSKPSGLLINSPTSPIRSQHESQGLEIADAGGLLSPLPQDARPARKSSRSHSNPKSTTLSPGRQPRSRSRTNSLLRSSLRNLSRASRSPSRARDLSPHSRNHSRGRTPGSDSDPATLARTVTAETTSSSAIAAALPSEPGTPTSNGEEIDTRAHARDWLAKIKAARERQNENHGITSRQAQVRRGDGEGGAGMELSDVGGLLDGGER